MKTVVQVSCLLLCASLFAACGFSSGLPSDTQGKDLTSDQRKQFCESTGDYMGDRLGEENSKKLGCLYGAAFAAAFGGDDKVAACQTSFDECMAAPAEESDDGINSCSAEATPECTATVAEMEACTEETVTKLLELLDDATCEAVMSSDGSELALGPRCKAVADKGCDP